MTIAPVETNGARVVETPFSAPSEQGGFAAFLTRLEVGDQQQDHSRGMRGFAFEPEQTRAEGPDRAHGSGWRLIALPNEETANEFGSHQAAEDGPSHHPPAVAPGMVYLARTASHSNGTDPLLVPSAPAEAKGLAYPAGASSHSDGHEPFVDQPEPAEAMGLAHPALPVLEGNENEPLGRLAPANGVANNAVRERQAMGSDDVPTLGGETVSFQEPGVLGLKARVDLRNAPPRHLPLAIETPFVGVGSGNAPLSTPHSTERTGSSARQQTQAPGPNGDSALRLATIRFTNQPMPFGQSVTSRLPSNATAYSGRSDTGGAAASKARAPLAEHSARFSLPQLQLTETSIGLLRVAVQGHFDPSDAARLRKAVRHLASEFGFGLGELTMDEARRPTEKAQSLGDANASRSG